MLDICQQKRGERYGRTVDDIVTELGGVDELKGGSGRDDPDVPDLPTDIGAPGVRLGHALRAFRHAKGLSQQQLGDLIGCPQVYVSRWERGAPALSLDMAATIEAALGAPRGYLLRLAGYVAEVKSTLDVLRADPELSNDGPRQDVVNAYLAAVKTSRKYRKGRRDS